MAHGGSLCALAPHIFHASAFFGTGSRLDRRVARSAKTTFALDAIPARLDTPLIFPGPEGGVVNLDNFRRRDWGPAIEAAGVQTPARIYDLRSTFASNALAAGVGVHTLARIMGTSVAMIERHYGTLIDGALESITGRLDAFDAQREREDQDERAADV
jgi:integrase